MGSHGIGYVPGVWQMEILVGAVAKYDPATRETEIVGGEWVVLKAEMPEGVDVDPWRFAYLKDAESCLHRLYPELPPWAKRVTKV